MWGYLGLPVLFCLNFLFFTISFIIPLLTINPLLVLTAKNMKYFLVQLVVILAMVFQCIQFNSFNFAMLLTFIFPLINELFFYYCLLVIQAFIFPSSLHMHLFFSPYQSIFNWIHLTSTLSMKNRTLHPDCTMCPHSTSRPNSLFLAID